MLLSFDLLPDRLTVTNAYYYRYDGLVEQYSYNRIIKKTNILHPLNMLGCYISCLVEIQLDDRDVYLLKTSEMVELHGTFPKQWTVYLLSATEIELITSP